MSSLTLGSSASLELLLGDELDTAEFAFLHAVRATLVTPVSRDDVAGAVQLELPNGDAMWT